MKKAIIYMFSGTGNTRMTVNMVKQSLISHQIATDIFEITYPFRKFPSPLTYDYLGFAYPIHAFNTPKLLLDFVSQLPSAKHKVFFLKTSGEPFRFNDASSYKLWRALTKKGYDVFQERHLLMPYNIIFRYPDDLVKQMVATNHALCTLFAQQIAQTIRKPIRYRFRTRLLSCIFRIQWPGAKLNGCLYSVNLKKCTKCQRCIQNCPTHNITLKNGHFHFGSHCTMCMRCVMFCPANAIRPGILGLWKVNGAYDFPRIIADDTLPCNFINSSTKGYFKLFRKYYRNAATEAADKIEENDFVQHGYPDDEY